MLWTILAAQLSLADAAAQGAPDLSAVISADDMPDYVQIAGITRFVPTRTTVRPDGTPEKCGVEHSSGDARLDAYTCAIILRRAKFQPSNWMDGTPVYGVFRMPVIWAVGFQPSREDVDKAFPPDIQISVDQLPKGARSPTNVSLMIAVDVDGRVAGCSERAPPPNATQRKDFPELVTIACQQMMSSYTAIPANDPSGKPVRSVQTASAVFVTK